MWGSMLSLVTSWNFWVGVLAVVLFYVFVIRSIVNRPQYQEKPNLTFIEQFDICGIDISHFQGTIDWGKLSESLMGRSRISFIVIKATEGETLTDDQFDYNFQQSIANGFITGAYHFYSVKSKPSDQAESYIKCVHLQQGDLAPVLDVERRGNKPLEEFQQDVLEWLRIVEEHYHAKPIIYASTSFRQSYLNTPEFAEYPFWVAHYGVDKPQCDVPWTFWQFSEHGYVEGIEGSVDLNVFNGSFADLTNLTIKE